MSAAAALTRSRLLGTACLAFLRVRIRVFGASYAYPKGCALRAQSPGTRRLECREPQETRLRVLRPFSEGGQQGRPACHLGIAQVFHGGDIGAAVVSASHHVVLGRADASEVDAEIPRSIVETETALQPAARIVHDKLAVTLVNENIGRVA